MLAKVKDTGHLLYISLWYIASPTSCDSISLIMLLSTSLALIEVPWSPGCCKRKPPSATKLHGISSLKKSLIK